MFLSSGRLNPEVERVFAYISPSTQKVCYQHPEKKIELEVVRNVGLGFERYMMVSVGYPVLTLTSS